MSEHNRCPSIDPEGDLQCGRRIHDDDQCQFGGIAWPKNGGTTPVPSLRPTEDKSPPHGYDWRDGLDALDALLDDCSQIGPDHENFVRVDAVRHIVKAIRRWEDDTDESIRSALVEDAGVSDE